MSPTPVQLALKYFAQKTHPTDSPAPADDDFGMGTGIVELNTLFSCMLTQISGNDVEPEELLSHSIEFEWFVNFFSQLRPLPLEESDCQVTVRLCEADQLERLTEGLDTDLKRDCFLQAGHYEQAMSIAGWDDFAGQSYPGQDLEFHFMGITNGQAYALCSQLQDMGVVGNSAVMIRLYLDIEQIANLSRQGQSPLSVRIDGGHVSETDAIAKALHVFARRKGPFQRLSTIEDRKGFFERCISEGGTLVLDELKHMDPGYRRRLFQALVDVSSAMVVITSNEDLTTIDGFQSDLLERISEHVTLDLVDGEALATMLKTLGLGVTTELVESVKVDTQWFDGL